MSLWPGPGRLARACARGCSAGDETRSGGDGALEERPDVRSEPDERELGSREVAHAAERVDELLTRRLRAERVEFKTDILNEQARKGLRNIGAIEEGTLRSFNYMPGGRRRDAIFYSVLRAEWPGVKQHLLSDRT